MARLNRIHREITNLQVLDTDDAVVRFRITKSPITGDDNVDKAEDHPPQECIINGLIYPKLSPYNEHTYEIEIKLFADYPFRAPTVRFIKPFYHPNVDERGK